MTREAPPLPLVLPGFALLAGLLAIAFEVVWLRTATAVFGASAPAVACTLSAFFLGTAAGCAVFGRVAARTGHPLSAYGLTQIGIALTALLVGPLFGLYRSVYSTLFASLAGRPPVFLLAKVALGLLAFVLPTFFIGGTIPLLAAAGGREERRTVLLYALNTLGAAAGALLAPVGLLATLGARGATLATAATSVALGVLALALDRGPRRGRPTTAATSAAASDARTPRALLVLALASGLLVLALETLAVRMLALAHESSVAAFAMVLAVFLSGLGLGALRARAVLRRPSEVTAVLASSWIAAGVVTALLPRLFLLVTHGLRPTSGLDLLFVAAALLLPVTVLAGTVLPLLLGRVRESAPLGRLLAASTLGSIVGPPLATFVLVPAIGLWWSLAATGLGMILCGLAAAGTRRTRALAAVAVVGALALGPRALPCVRLRDGDRLVSLREGALGSVAVLEDADGDRRVKLDNAYLLGGTASGEDERMQGHLPLLLHPAPRRVAFLGLATGITASAALLHPTERIEVLELVPEVVAAARTDLAAANRGLLEAPRVTVVTDDARSWLLGAQGELDVIVGDLFVPWRPGEASLYTRETFAAARARLAPGGLFCQWVPLYQVSEGELLTLAATFADVFPRTTLWRADFAPAGSALALCGEADAYRLDPDAIDRSVRAASRELATSVPLLADPAGLWLHFLGPLDTRDPRLASARRNTDGDPGLELRPAHERALGPEALLPFDTARLAVLGDTRLRARDAGVRLGHAAVLAAAGDFGEAERVADEALAALPEATRDAFLAPRSPPAGAR